MKFLNAYPQIIAALIVGAAGIAGIIDENSMIVMTVVIICCMPSARRCRAAWSAEG